MRKYLSIAIFICILFGVMIFFISWHKNLPLPLPNIDNWYRSDIVDNPLTVSLNKDEIVFIMVLGVWTDQTGRTEKPCWVRGIITEENETRFIIRTGIEAMGADPAHLTKKTGVWRTYDKEHIPDEIRKALEK